MADDQLVKKIGSPCKKWEALFFDAGEIRFGPNYYYLKIPPIELGKRIFGETAIWSGDSRFFACQEWHSAKESDGPKTSLLVIDIEKHKEVRYPVIRGFDEPIRFSGSVLHHEQKIWEASGASWRVAIETDLTKSNFTPLQ